MARFPLRIACHYAIGVAITAALLHTFFLLGLVAPVTVSGSSMWPTLRDGERLVVDRTAFILRGPRRGEIVVFRCPDRANELCVKRVFALPGERVGLVDGELTLHPPRQSDGQAGRQAGAIQSLSSPQIDQPPDGFDWVRRTLGAPQFWELSHRLYFVVGDNRAVSEDSRSWVSSAGLDARLVVGRPVGVR